MNTSTSRSFRAPRGLRAIAAAATAIIVTAGSVLVATPAVAATVYEISGRWAENAPSVVASGDVVTAEWRVNVNDDAAAPANEPVDNVTFEVTIPRGAFSALPDACLVTGVTPASSISPDGKTLVCNLGTQDQGTAHVVQTPIRADGQSGDRIDAVATIGDETADVPFITIENPFAMDMVWQTPTSGIGWADNYVDIDVQWTLFTQAGSDPGPDSVSYRLDVTNPVGAEIRVGPQACSPFTTGGATGHPWSGAGHPAEQTAPFVDGCSLTRNADGSFTLTLTGIDYSRLQVPTRDSVGRALPANREAVASGTVWFRFMSGANNSMTLTSSAPTYQSPSGATSTDDPSNNTSNKVWTRGGWSNAWQPEFTGIQVPSWWSNEFRVSPGRTVQSTTTAEWASSNPATVFGQCQILDTRYVDFVWAEISHGWGGASLPGVALEYYVGSAVTVDPASGSYDPNAFRCDQDPAGWTTTPAAGQTVKAVRALYPFSAMTGNPRSSLNVRHMIKPTAPVGTDVWEWGAAYVNGAWQYPARSMNPAEPTRWGPLTPGKRYPYAESGRDVLYVIGVTPAVTKSVDRSSVKPGVPATYTLTYSANGTGAIDPTVDDFGLVDTLPAGMTYVPGSANPAPTVTTNGSGQQVLTWDLDGVPTNALQTLTYQAVAAADVTPGAALTNSVVASVEGESSTPATAQVTVSTNGFTSIAKSTDRWFIANPDGDGSGESGSWTVTLRSEDPLPQAFTDTIDILPYEGDGRGTDFEGTYDVTGVDVPAGATVYYTTDAPATLSDDPSDRSNGPAPGTVDPARWSTAPVANPTAIRVIGGELAPGATFAFTVHIQPEGAEPGDVYVNRAQAIAEHTELVMRTSEPLTMGAMYSVSLKKYVQDRDGNWVDANDAAEYPSFRPGETVNYRIVVTNTGQGTLRDLVVTDDKQPELGSFEIAELLPGEDNAHVEEYSIVLEEGGLDTVVNNACVNVSTLPADMIGEVQESCDPAGFEVDGDPTHEKTLLSATPIGNGQWEVVYGIDVTNTSAHPTSYDLADTLRFTPEATIVSAQVTDSPAGVTLATPAWNGQGEAAIAQNVPLLGNDDPGYAAHHYELTVIAEVPLQVPGAGANPDSTSCPGDGSDAEQGFNNTSQLTDARGGVEDDQACAPIPSIDIDKGVSAGPVPNGDGTWTVTYDIVATNDGAFDGTYRVTDRMTADGDLEVVSGSVTTAPAGVTPNASWTGLGAEGADENVIASGVTLPAGASHTYRVEVIIGIADGVTGVPVVTSCAADPNESGGLSNAAGIEHNDLTDEAEACVTIAYVTVDKTISDGPTPNGDGTYTIVYDIVAENVGGGAGEYDLYDRLRYGAGIDIISADVVTTPGGVTAEGSWTGRGPDDDSPENLVAENVPLAAGGLHTYQVEVVVETDEATVDPNELRCPAPGSGDNGGLANSASVDHNGIIAQDEDCASLPLIDVDKEISDGPTPNGDGTWTITYDLVATNTGGAAGDYDVRDQLRYGDGIVVESATVSTAPVGVTPEAGWTGQGADLRDAENLVAGGIELEAGGTHTYQVQVVVSMDRDVVTPEDLACPAPGSGDRGGLANTVELEHNGETRDDEDCAPLPLIDTTKSLSGAVTPVDGQDGVYDVTYEITAINRGPGAGSYDLDDTLAPGDGVTIVGIEQVVTDAPDPVGINSGFDGLGDVRIVTGQPIDGATGAPVVHTYTVTVRYAVDLSDVEIRDTESCTTGDGSTVPGGLNNVATVGWNGIEESDDECVRPGKPTLDKSLVSAKPVGDGKWEVVYDLTVGNVGTEATTYDLDDEFLFAPVITVDSVAVDGPDGVTVNPGFDGDADQVIATDVSIAGLDDDGYAPHIYRVAVVANVPLHFDAAEPDGTGAPGCTMAPGGNFIEQGLNNAATLTDETGGTQTDTDCAPLPSIEIDKAMDGDPVAGEDGLWTVRYVVTATNDGAAAGEYDLVDRLRYGAGLEVRSAVVIDAPEGVTPSSSWTGRGEDGSDENVVAADVALGAGVTHTYRVSVTAVLDTDAADASTLACPKPGSGEPGGFANTAGLAHNGLSDAAGACAVPEWPEDVPSPLERTGATIAAGVIGAAVLLLLLGGGLLIARRRRIAAA
ncbi:DUF11 domain-containing protein [Microbacterium sp. Marseille-Q6965]|uniref:DUF11 domain-containing protein n=1 Tax=Microbacterium sp. Marseille-Q6965 TaxID=2965072 RepID=UPI0021B8450C|nr:DUF11 domain-containing protein [Microbacterium sp. Marseille-Q6965]